MLSNKPDGPEISYIRGLGEHAQFSWSIAFDPQHHLWIGCDQGRLIRYDPVRKKADSFQPAAFEKSGIRQIVSDADGTLWIGLQNGNLFVFTPPESSEPFQESSLRLVQRLGGPINRMVFGNRHDLWVTINGKGIALIDQRSGQIRQSTDIRKAGSVLIAGVRDILPINDTICLLASDKLGNLNSKTFRANFDYPPGKPLKGTIFSLQKDQQQQVWIGSSEGVSRLNPLTGVLNRYSQDDGLITVHNNSYVPERGLALSDGRLVFGGNQNMVVFNPEEYQKAAAPPVVTLTGLSVNDRYLPADSLAQLSSITLPYTHSTLGIDFAALSFLQKGRLTYEYQLEGHDQDWIPSGATPRVRYHLLPHGRYRFLVRAKNEQGEYSPVVTALNLDINPPFWKTIWFYALIILTMAGLLYYLDRIRLDKLQHIEKVRNRLARDLHDDMGSTLSTINILSNMALQQNAPDTTRNRQYLDTISKSTLQMMEAMDDIVWSINPVNDGMAKILARMKETTGNILEPAQIDYRFEVGPEIPDLYLSMEVRREIFLIFKEALNNIVKYANCSLVFIKLSRKGADFNLIIEDDGVGFELPAPESTVRGNGLKNMHNRAGNIRGTLVVNSLPGKGTSIHLSVSIA